jgi:hypothetical protein
MVSKFNGMVKFVEIGENFQVPHHPSGYRGGWVHYKVVSI